jgi:hypothetical protein
MKDNELIPLIIEYVGGTRQHKTSMALYDQTSV